ncbi:hypothetical protein Goarm_004817 [Gossypium armourianum]|uniref:Protein kinase domain-containing protein n=1 Tax=Gossypium armourianum TaxID=34283 RepID=A0A7J9JXY8_9ROSI|nr:hypothetical protein [Gossypium armourianum]
MNDGDGNCKRRRKERFADEDLSDMNESSNDENSVLMSTHKRKTRTVLGFYDSVASASVNQTETQSPNHDKQSGLGPSWWDECNRPDYPEDEFKKVFRMSKSTFELICFELSSEGGASTLRNAISVKQRVAVCVWQLATGEPLRLVSKRFGLGISACRESVLEVCSAICSVLMPKYLRWPDVKSLRKIKEEFEVISWIPNVVGSMYRTHVPITPPKTCVAGYLNERQTEGNRKTSYSVTVQGVVDPRGVFTDVCIGWPGSMNDYQVLEKSSLYQRANCGLLNGVWVVGSWGLFSETLHKLGISGMNSVHQVVLGWPTRLQIVVAAAQGLCYMQDECLTPIIHHDVKSSNILLYSEFNAKSSNFGL